MKISVIIFILYMMPHFSVSKTISNTNLCLMKNLVGDILLHLLLFLPHFENHLLLLYLIFLKTISLFELDFKTHRTLLSLKWNLIHRNHLVLNQQLQANATWSIHKYYDENRTYHLYQFYKYSLTY